MPQNPQVSVIVPAFNEPPDTLAESLRSVSEQTFHNLECIVVDESTDPVRAQACESACAKDSRFRYVKPPTRLGLAGSLNEAISLARAPLLARFDSDDVCMPERLERQVEFMSAHSEVGVLGGGLEIISENGESLAFRDYPLDHASIERSFHWSTPVAHPTVMLRKNLVEQYGRYDPSFRFAEDLDLWLRMLNQGVRFANLPQTLVRYRQDNTSRSQKHWQFNRRARLRNFSPRLAPLRLVGLAGISLWGWLPARVQQQVFKPLVLRSAR